MTDTKTYVQLHPKVIETLKALRKTERRRVVAAIDRLPGDPTPAGPAEPVAGADGDVRKFKVGPLHVFYQDEGDALTVLLVERVPKSI